MAKNVNFAGHYIPQLAELMLQFNRKEMLFNLKGIAVSIEFHSLSSSFVSHYF